MATYNQPALTLDQQIKAFRNKGLSISNEEEARHWLSNVSYFRLKNYTHKFRKRNDPEKFEENTTFEQVLDLYLFDRRLKFILFDALECIEVAVKTLISHKMSGNHSITWYANSSYFSALFDFERFIFKVKQDFTEYDESSATAYRKIYTESQLPPSWMVMETLTLGTISLIFEHLTARTEKGEISNHHFKLPENILISWLHCFTVIRNRCAHHSRIVYRSVLPEPLLPSRQKHKFLQEANNINRSSLYCALCCMQYMVLIINPQSLFKQNLFQLLEAYPHIKYEAMGFTKNWRQEIIWS